MANAKKIMTAAGTFSAALGIGFIMQYGDALAGRFAPAEETPAVLPQQQEATDALTSAAPDTGVVIPETSVASLAPMPGTTQAADVATPIAASVTTVADSEPTVAGFGADALTAPVIAAEVTVATAETAVLPVPEVAPAAAPAPDCSARMTGRVMPLAMVSLDLTAPCHTNAAFTLHHQGMMFTALTDAEGRAMLTVPGLSEAAFFMASFDDGISAATQVPLPEMANYDRAVLQWQGRPDVELHALEFGAGYADDGHIWKAAAGDIAEASAGASGFLTSLGATEANSPLMAEVYTFPTGLAARAGKVVLSVEAEVTAANCGRDISAQTIQIAPGHDAAAVDLTMTMPACDMVGEFLVLKNMLKDLTLAAK